MTIYERIKNRRIELGMSQQELADKVGYKTKSAINKIELGWRDISQSKILAFAEALQTTPSYLLGYDAKGKNKEIVKTQKEEFTEEEKFIINKYRSLDDYGKKLVNLVVDEEYRRINKKIK